MEYIVAVAEVETSRGKIFEVGVVHPIREELVATYRLIEMPSCGGIVILSKIQVKEHLRGQGLGGVVVRTAFEVAKVNRYAVMVCTVVNSNEIMKKVLAKAEFKQTFDFLNFKTSNVVNFYYKTI